MTERAMFYFFTGANQEKRENFQSLVDQALEDGFRLSRVVAQGAVTLLHMERDVV